MKDLNYILIIFIKTRKDLYKGCILLFNVEKIYVINK